MHAASRGGSSSSNAIGSPPQLLRQKPTGTAYFYDGACGVGLEPFMHLGFRVYIGILEKKMETTIG